MDYWSNPKKVAGRLQYRIDMIKQGDSAGGTAAFLKEQAAKLDDPHVQKLLAELKFLDGSHALND